MIVVLALFFVVCIIVLFSGLAIFIWAEGKRHREFEEETRKFWEEYRDRH